VHDNQPTQPVRRSELARAARDAVDDFVRELQANIDASDAEHPVVGPSRYRTVYVSAPAPEVAIAQVRRDALDADGKPVPIDDPSTFSEMALYVLVRRVSAEGLLTSSSSSSTTRQPRSRGPE
jgi:hypothetical protein